MSMLKILSVSCLALGLSGCATVDTFLEDWVAPVVGAYAEQQFEQNNSVYIPPSTSSSSRTTDNPGESYYSGDQKNVERDYERNGDLPKCDWEWQPGDNCEP